MTYEADTKDLAHHEAEITAHETFLSERALDDFVPRWLAETWGLSAVDLSP